jgi:phage host-nuclease inhibitor protein Gam
MVRDDLIRATLLQNSLVAVNVIATKTCRRPPPADAGPRKDRRLVADSLDVVPQRPRVLKPRSLEDLNVNLEWLAYYKSRQANAKAACDAKCRLAKSEEAKRLRVEVDGRHVGLADAVAEIQKVSIAFVLAHRDAVFCDGTKTRELTHGTISLRARPKGIELAEEVSEEDVLARIEAKAGLLTRIADWLEKKCLGLATRTFYRIKSELNTQGIKEAFLADALSEPDLRSIGFVPCGGDEVCKIEPAAYTLNSERTK